MYNNMRAKAFLGALLVLTAVSCAPTPSATPSPSTTPLPIIAVIATATPTTPPSPTATSAPTRTPTVTPVPFPTLSGLSVPVSDPRVANPELFDLRRPDAPIPQFINAMKIGGVELSTEQIVRGITYQQMTGSNGDPFIVATTPDGTPLLIAEKNEKGEWFWSETTPRKLADAKGIKAIPQKSL